MGAEPYWYRAELLRVVDGDTVDALLDLGFQLRWRVRFRLYGINAPELRYPAGVAAKAHLEALLAEPGELLIRSHRDQADKYGGRWLGTLFKGPIHPAAASVNTRMVADGHAVPYRE